MERVKGRHHPYISKEIRKPLANLDLIARTHESDKGKNRGRIRGPITRMTMLEGEGGLKGRDVLPSGIPWDEVNGYQQPNLAYLVNGEKRVSVAIDIMYHIILNGFVLVGFIIRIHVVTSHC